ncbi:cupin domain-containing protein [Allopontixanthobacter sediminis]|uniref:Cupin domain-containing protein n=1 Tax=Allopontixanthobacter sediminis TaxID=1689985 RepID=A0A845B3Q9_9SPHN|nr:cupin domain-containing protein [Allopontixanthobacter sediminis]MXP44057.1 cupin domain-containing protein [Allopontixanthobacter sediminis]
MQFTDFDTETFLRDYWQKKPLLIRNPWAQWTNPLEPDELAGLACEDDVEARLVSHAGGALTAEDGPIPAERFGELGRDQWTLLVQAVDHFVPDVAALIEPFRFVPNWRIDDVMVSVAADGGGVGAHFDHYDVFLIQGLGRRRWQVGAMCDERTPLLPHDQLRLIADFEPLEEWVLEPGDILYVPPGIAHNGAAVGDNCMTYSVGFRAPSRAELIGDFCDDLLDTMTDDDRYGDPQLSPQDNPGEIAGTAINKLHAMLLEGLSDREAFARWFGKYNSTPKYPEIDWRPEDPVSAAEIVGALASKVPLHRNPASRFSFVRQNGGILLFADGECFECRAESAELAELLCAQTAIMVEDKFIHSASAIDLITRLYNQGSLAFEAED